MGTENTSGTPGNGTTTTPGTTPPVAGAPAATTPPAAGAAPPAAVPPVADPKAGDAGTKTALGGAGEPADIQLKFADGLEVDNKLVDGFKAVAKELKLDSAGAQKIADVYATIAQEHAKAADEAKAAQQAQWREAAKSDKAFGGKDFEANIKAASLAVQKYGGPELVQLLNETGYGDHPAVIRAFAAIAKASAEDSSAGAGAGSNGQAAPKSLATLLYPPQAAKS
jgi:hypothetical protein